MHPTEPSGAFRFFIEYRIGADQRHAVWEERRRIAKHASSTTAVTKLTVGAPRVELEGWRGELSPLVVVSEREEPGPLRFTSMTARSSAASHRISAAATRPSDLGSDGLGGSTR